MSAKRNKHQEQVTELLCFRVVANTEADAYRICAEWKGFSNSLTFERPRATTEHAKAQYKTRPLWNMYLSIESPAAVERIAEFQ